MYWSSKELLESNNLLAGWSGFEPGSTPLQSNTITDRNHDETYGIGENLAILRYFRTEPLHDLSSRKRGLCRQPVERLDT